MEPVTPDRCDHWHGLLALEVVGQIVEEDRLALTAHLDGCQACRDERNGLAGLSGILPAADPDHISGHEVPFELQSAVFDRLRADARRHHRRRGTRFVAGGVAAAVVAAALVFALSGSSGSPRTGYTVALSGNAGVTATARLTSEAWGTAVHLEETGQRGDQVLTVSMRTTSGSWWAAGTYRTVTGHAVRVDLACGVPVSDISSIWVRTKTGHTVLHGYVT
jgi:predicted anti-sigma-YlaC factor YlaD